MDITRKIVERLSIKHASTELGEVMAWLEEQDYDIIRSGALRVSATKAAARQLHTVAERIIDQSRCDQLADVCSDWDDPIIEFNPKNSIRIPATFHFCGKLPPPDFSEELEESNAILREIAAEFHMDSLRRVETALQEARELLETLVPEQRETDHPLWYNAGFCRYCKVPAYEERVSLHPPRWRAICEHEPDCIVTRARAWLAKYPKA